MGDVVAGKGNKDIRLLVVPPFVRSRSCCAAALRNLCIAIMVCSYVIPYMHLHHAYIHDVVVHFKDCGHCRLVGSGQRKMHPEYVHTSSRVGAIMVGSGRSRDTLPLGPSIKHAFCLCFVCCCDPDPLSLRQYSIQFAGVECLQNVPLEGPLSRRSRDMNWDVRR